MIRLARINEEAQWKTMRGAHILVDDSGKIIAGPDPSKKSGQNSKKKALTGKKKALAKKKSRGSTKDALARSEALLKKLNINESINPFKGMKKVKSEDNPRATYATDGYGNTYEVPKTGYSDTIRIDDGDNKFLVRYNYKNKEVEVLSKSDKEIMHSIQLNVLDWLDNPEYWAETAVSEMDNELGLSESSVDSYDKPGYFVKFNYDGDELSDYVSTAIVIAYDKQEALKYAKKYLPTEYEGACHFSIDKQFNKYYRTGEIINVAEYLQDFPHFNGTILDSRGIIS